MWYSGDDGAGGGGGFAGGGAGGGGGGGGGRWWVVVVLLQLLRLDSREQTATPRRFMPGASCRPRRHGPLQKDGPEIRNSPAASQTLIQVSGFGCRVSGPI